MRQPRVALAVCAALAVAGLPGCGDEAAEDFVERGDRLCREFDRATAGLGQELEDAAGNEAEIARVLASVADQADATAERFERLRPPADRAADVERYIAGTRAQIDRLRRAGRALAEGDQERFTELFQAVEDTENRINQQARDIGFDECGDELPSG